MLVLLFNMKTSYPRLHNRLRKQVQKLPVQLSTEQKICKWFEVILVA